MDHQAHLRSLFISNFSSTRGMLHTARAAIGALPMIARALLARANKPIRIVVDPRTNTGSTDCETMIRLPVVPLPKNDEDIDGCIDVAATLYGLLHHEVGHCNHSDIADFRVARAGLERALVNIIEDVRMELMHIRDLPASRAYLDALNVVMAKKGLWCVPTGCEDPPTVFKAYIGFRTNALYRNEPVSKTYLAQMRTMFVDMFTPELAQRLDELLEETPQLTNSRGSFELARKVIALIQDEQQSAQQPQSQDPTPPADDDAKAESKDSGKGEEGTQDVDNDGQGDSDADSDAEAQADAEGNADDDTTAAGNDDQGDDSDDDADAQADADSTGSQSDANSDAEASADADDDAKDSGQDADPDADAQADSEPGDSGANSDASASAGAQDNAQGSNTGNSTPSCQASADASGNASDGSSTSGSSSTPPATLNDKLNSLLSTDDDTGSDRHDAANQMLQQLVEQMAQSAYMALNLEQAMSELVEASDESGECTRELITGANHDLDAGYYSALEIRRKLLSELDAITNADTFIGQRGSRLSSRHLHRVISGDSRVFKRTIDGVAPSTAVMLVQDVSGSMQGEPVRIASQALYASAVALEGIEGIEVAAMAFPGNGLVIDFGESPRFRQDRFQLSSWGGTPMGQGIHVALNGLLAQHQERKLMIVLTDGEPDNLPLALTMIATAEQNGIEVFGVGILTDSVQRLFSRSVRIDDVNELPERLVALVRDEVLQSIAA